MDNQGMDPQQKVDGPPPQYVQPGYPVQQQGGYPAQHQQGGYPAQPYGHQAGYVQQPPTMVSQQPPPPNYSFPLGKVPSIILLLVAVFNFLFFIILGAVSGLWLLALFLVPFIAHGIVGGLGFVGSFTTQTERHSACAICCIVAAVFSLIVSFWQVIALSIYAGVIANIHIMWPEVIRIFAEFAAFVCSIAMIVIPSQRVCCRRQPPAGGQVIYMSPQQTSVPAQ